MEEIRNFGYDNYCDPAWRDFHGLSKEEALKRKECVLERYAILEQGTKDPVSEFLEKLAPNPELENDPEWRDFHGLPPLPSTD